MRLVSPSEVEVLNVRFNFCDGAIEEFTFIRQLIPQLNGDVNFSVNGIFLGIDHVVDLIETAKRQHKAVRHYHEHLAELIRLSEVLISHAPGEDMDSQDQDLRELEIAA